MMKWSISGSNVNLFLQMNPSSEKTYMQSPTIFYHQIEWVLYIYPRGYKINHQFVKIFLCSKGKLPDNTSHEIPTIIELTSSLNGTKWNKRVVLNGVNEKNHSFSYEFEDKIPITFINSITPNSKQPANIIFHCTLNLDNNDENEIKNDNIYSIDNKQQHNDDNNNNNNNNNNNDDMISKQILSTVPSFTKSEIFGSNVISNTNIWTITGTEMHRFNNAKCNEYFESPTFVINDGSEWNLVIYPNGTQEKKGSVAVFLRCSKFADLMETVTVLIDSYCHETDTYSSNTHVFGINMMENGYQRRSSIGIWHPYTLETISLKYHKSITIEIKLTILKSQFSQYQSNRGLGFISNIQSFRPFGPKVCIKWILPCSPSFCNARMEKQFISKRFDIWCLRCKPNHYGSVLLELYLVTAPLKINDLEIEIILKCRKFNIINKQITTFKKTGEKYREWKNVNLSTEKLRNLKWIKFEAEINILHQYDNRGQEIFEINNISNNNEQKQYQQQKEEKKQQEINTVTMQYFENKMIEIEKYMESMEMKQKETTKNLQKFHEKEKKISNINYNDYYDDDDDIENDKRLEIWFFNQLRLPQYYQVFLDDGWDDIDVIKDCLEEKHLERMKINKQGHRVKILQHINMLKQQTNQ